MTSVSKPVPMPSPETREFWDAAKDQRLLIRRCSDCGHRQSAESLNCSSCLSNRMEWEVSPGRGEVISYVIYRRVYHPGFRDDVPYVVALVELDEGPRMVANVTGVDPDEMTAGVRVIAHFEERSGYRLAQFMVAG